MTSEAGFAPVDVDSDVESSSENPSRGESQDEDIDNFPEHEESTNNAFLIDQETEEYHERYHHRRGNEAVALTTPLTRQETWNLTLCVLAWACTICNITLVIGTSSLVVMSIEGDVSISSIPLGVFFFGASLISLTVTPWLFNAIGRKGGFLIGIVIGLIGSFLGAVSVWGKWPPLLIFSTGLFGASTGIGFFLRFAVLEVVPVSWSSRALALVVSGGCIAAIVGPESSHATQDWFDGDLKFLNVYCLTTICCIINFIMISCVKFRDDEKHEMSQQVNTFVNSQITQMSSGNVHNIVSEGDKYDPEESGPHTDIMPIFSVNISAEEIRPLLSSRRFVTPMLLASLSWAIMAVPMSLVRVAMEASGFSSRKSLTVMELHFLAMYICGFFTGKLIRRHGSRYVAWLGAGLFGVGAVLMMLVEHSKQTRGEYADWAFGMIFSGLGWGLTFTPSTSWLTAIYLDAPRAKNAIQSANDFCFFLLSGVWVFSASYIYSVGGEGVSGWKLLIFFVIGLLGVLVITLIVDQHLEDNERVETVQKLGRNAPPKLDRNTLEDQSDMAIV